MRSCLVLLAIVACVSGCVAQQDAFTRDIKARASCGDNCEVECSAAKEAAKQEIRK